MRGRMGARRWLWVLAAMGGALACGPTVDIDWDTGGGTGGSGPPCFSDQDCVPNACCGTGTGVVGIAQAPDCAGVRCNNNCPVGQLNCGCGLPVCRDGHCTVAVTFGGGCP